MTNSGMSAFLFGIAGLFLIASVSFWLKVGKDRERVDQVPRVPVAHLRTAANITAVAFGLLGVALVWFAIFGIAD